MSASFCWLTRAMASVVGIGIQTLSDPFATRGPIAHLPARRRPDRRCFAQLCAEVGVLQFARPRS